MQRGGRVWLSVAVVMTVAAFVSAQSTAAPQMRRMSGNGVDLTYIDAGKGAPVVFIHGALADLRYWEPQREAFARKYRFIAYTYRYHGTEPWPDDGKNYNDATHAADLTAFLTGLKAAPVHLVGLSYGGLLAAMVATEHPELVRSLTLAEPALFSLLTDPEAKPAIEAFNKGVQETVGLLKAGDQSAALKTFIGVVTGGGPDAFDELPEAQRRVFEDNARTMPMLFTGQLTPVACETLGKMKIPTLVVEGARTPDWFRLINKATVSCIPGSRIVKIPDASHPMSADNPAAFNRAVLEFIAKQ